MTLEQLQQASVDLLHSNAQMQKAVGSCKSLCFLCNAEKGEQ